MNQLITIEGDPTNERVDTYYQTLALVHVDPNVTPEQSHKASRVARAMSHHPWCVPVNGIPNGERYNECEKIGFNLAHAYEHIGIGLIEPILKHVNQLRGIDSYLSSAAGYAETTDSQPNLFEVCLRINFINYKQEERFETPVVNDPYGTPYEILTYALTRALAIINNAMEREI